MGIYSQLVTGASVDSKLELGDVRVGSSCALQQQDCYLVKLEAY